MGQTSQSQSHHSPSNNFTESNHYPGVDGQYPRTSTVSISSVDSPANNSQLHPQQYIGYPQSRLSSSVNGPSSHNYYGPPGQLPQQQQSYEQQPPQHQHPRNPYDNHHGSRPMTPGQDNFGAAVQLQPQQPHPGQMLRYPGPGGHHPPTSSSGYGSRPPYVPSPSHHSSSNNASHYGVPQPSPSTSSSTSLSNTQSQTNQVPYSSSSSIENFSKNTDSFNVSCV